MYLRQSGPPINHKQIQSTISENNPTPCKT